MDQTKERILAAALDLFSIKGYAAVCTKGIAVAAGVNEVTLFRSFGSKRNLYIEVYHRFSVAPSELSVLAEVRGDLRADLLSIGRAIASLFIRNSKIVRMSLKDMESFPEIDRDLKRQPENLIVLVSEYFRRAAETGALSGDPAHLARIFVTALMGTVLHLQRFSGEDSGYAFAEAFTEIFFRGIERKTA